MSMPEPHGPVNAFGRAVGIVIGVLVAGTVILALLTAAAWLFRTLTGSC